MTSADKKKKKKKKSVPALRRGLRMLESIAAAEGEIGFQEVLAGVDIPRATAARLLQALREEGYVAKADNGYRLGPKLNQLLLAGTMKQKFRLAALPLLKELMEQTGNTATAFYWDGNQTEVVAKEMHPAAVVMQPVGNRGGLNYGCPWSLYFFRSLAETGRQAFIRAAKRDRRWAAVQRQLDFASRRGFAYDDCTSLPGVRRLAAPVYAGGNVIGCLTLGGTPYTIPDAELPTFGALLRRHADRLTESLSVPT